MGIEVEELSSCTVGSPSFKNEPLEVLLRGGLLLEDIGAYPDIAFPRCLGYSPTSRNTPISGNDPGLTMGLPGASGIVEVVLWAPGRRL